VADVVIVGSGTLAADPHHVWTADAICPELAPDYRRLRENMRKPGPALNVVVSTSGAVDLRLPVFAAGRVPALILTSPSGARRLATQRRPVGVRVRAIGARNGHIAPRAILGEVARLRPGRRILLEGGPQLLGSFYRDGLIDEQFLTLAPQIAGRAAGDGRLSLVMGQLFAPRNPRWGSLSDARRGHSHLFLRYSFPARPPI
jgi:riboflavin biosynthesis pyrimidine reductase